MFHQVSRFINVATAFSVVGLGYWVDQMSKGLANNQKGNFFDRMEEVVGAFQLSCQMQDPYTARYHPHLVASLPSKTFTLQNDQSQTEKAVARKSYGKGYLLQVWRTNPETPPLIFRYGKLLSHPIPGDKSSSVSKGFVFAGSSSTIRDPRTRDRIIEGTYIRCVSEKNTTENRKREIILTETTDPKSCTDFTQALLRDLAFVEKASPKGPMY